MESYFKIASLSVFKLIVLSELSLSLFILLVSANILIFLETRQSFNKNIHALPKISPSIPRKRTNIGKSSFNYSSKVQVFVFYRQLRFSSER